MADSRLWCGVAFTFALSSCTKPSSTDENPPPTQPLPNDTTPPRVSVLGVSDRDLLNTPATITWTVTDEHPASVAATLDALSFASGETVSQDGDHLLIIHATDVAGNSTEVSLQFALDLTPPNVFVCGVMDGSVSREAFVSFGVTDVRLTSAEGLLDGSPLSPLSGDACDPDPSTNGTQVGEGDHVLIVSAVDGAGNRGDRSIAFAVDLTRPEISVGGVSDGQLSYAPVVPTIEVVDPHLNAVDSTLDGQPFTSGDTVDSDGPHFLYVYAVDSTGNDAYLNLSFSLRLGPCVGEPALAQDLDALNLAFADAQATRIIGQPELEAFYDRHAAIDADLELLRQACTLQLQDQLQSNISYLTYDVRSWLNRGVVGMTSLPPAYVIAGEAVAYQPRLSSDPAGFVFTLPQAPSGVTIDFATGLVTWMPTSADKGTYAFTIEASNGAALASQQFTLTVAERRLLLRAAVTSVASVVQVSGTGTPLDGSIARVPADLVTGPDELLLYLIDPPPAPGSDIRMENPALDVQLASAMLFGAPLEVELPLPALAAGETAGLFAWSGADAAFDGEGSLGTWLTASMGSPTAPLVSPGMVAAAAFRGAQETTNSGNYRINTTLCRGAEAALSSAVALAHDVFVVQSGFRDPTQQDRVEVEMKVIPNRPGETVRGMATRTHIAVQCGLTGDALQNVVGHELFHVIQMHTTWSNSSPRAELRMRGGAKWWMESTAEYMGNRLNSAGARATLLRPAKPMVEESLTNDGINHMYDSFIFFDYITQRHGFVMRDFWSTKKPADLMDATAATVLDSAIGPIPYQDFVHAYNASRTPTNFALIGIARTAPSYLTPTMSYERWPLADRRQLPHLSSRTYRIAVPPDDYASNPRIETHLMVSFSGVNAEAWLYREGDEVPVVSYQPSADEQDAGAHPGEMLWIHVVNKAIVPSGDGIFDLSVRLMPACRGPVPDVTWDTVWPPTGQFVSADQYCSNSWAAWSDKAAQINWQVVPSGRYTLAGFLSYSCDYHATRGPDEYWPDPVDLDCGDHSDPNFPVKCTGYQPRMLPTPLSSTWDFYPVYFGLSSRCPAGWDVRLRVNTDRSTAYCSCGL